MNLFARREAPHALAVGMAGVKMGDRLVQIGCAHGGRLGALAAKVGLSGRAAAIVPDADSAARAKKGAEQAGALVEIEIAPPARLPLDDAAFDVAVVDDTGGLLAAMPAGDRASAVRELARVLRPAGRVMVIGAGRRTGLAALLARSGDAEPSFAASGEAVRLLQENGFASVRLLAEREGLVFVEGIKPRT